MADNVATHNSKSSAFLRFVKVSSNHRLELNISRANHFISKTELTLILPMKLPTACTIDICGKNGEINPKYTLLKGAILTAAISTVSHQILRLSVNIR